MGGKSKFNWRLAVVLLIAAVALLVLLFKWVSEFPGGKYLFWAAIIIFAVLPLGARAKSGSSGDENKQKSDKI